MIAYTTQISATSEISKYSTRHASQKLIMFRKGTTPAASPSIGGLTLRWADVQDVHGQVAQHAPDGPPITLLAEGMALGIRTQRQLHCLQHTSTVTIGLPFIQQTPPNTPKAPVGATAFNSPAPRARPPPRGYAAACALPACPPSACLAAGFSLPVTCPFWSTGGLAACSLARPTFFFFTLSLIVLATHTPAPRS
jgi:hypothetical protein